MSEGTTLRELFEKYGSWEFECGREAGATELATPRYRDALGKADSLRAELLARLASLESEVARLTEEQNKPVLVSEWRQQQDKLHALQDTNVGLRLQVMDLQAEVSALREDRELLDWLEELLRVRRVAHIGRELTGDANDEAVDGSTYGLVVHGQDHTSFIRGYDHTPPITSVRDLLRTAVAERSDA